MFKTAGQQSHEVYEFLCDCEIPGWNDDSDFYPGM